MPPVDCICEGARAFYIPSDECVGCAACEPVCPVEAICYEDGLSAAWLEFTADTLVSSGHSPGGAAGSVQTPSWPLATPARAAGATASDTDVPHAPEHYDGSTTRQPGGNL